MRPYPDNLSTVDYAYITWYDDGPLRRYAHPWCGRWAITRYDAPDPSPGSSEVCQNCKRILRLKPAVAPIPDSGTIPSGE